MGTIVLCAALLGHQVTAINRQATPGAETSFANGGQISGSHAEPWANPSAPLKLLQWLGKEDAPLLFRLRVNMRQWLWGLQFLRECTPARTRHNIAQIVRLGTYSRDVLQQLRCDTGIQSDQRTQGILHCYTSAKEFDGTLGPAEQMRQLGCERQVISADEAVRIEPALVPIRPQLAGATFTAEDESGDANAFTRELATLCAEAGVPFRMGCHIQALREVGRSIYHVEVTNEESRFERIRGAQFVLAMGSFSPLLEPPPGISLPIYPAKGYSVTLPVKDASKAHQVSLTDDEFKRVFSRYTSGRGSDRLCIAGTAEFNGYDRHLNAVRCEAIVRRTEQLFSGADDTTQAPLWSGLRPPCGARPELRSDARRAVRDPMHGDSGQRQDRYHGAMDTALWLQAPPTHRTDVPAHPRSTPCPR